MNIAAPVKDFPIEGLTLAHVTELGVDGDLEAFGITEAIEFRWKGVLIVAAETTTGLYAYGAATMSAEDMGDRPMQARGKALDRLLANIDRLRQRWGR